MGFFRPDTKFPDGSTAVQRTGLVLYWGGSGIALLFVLAALVGAVVGTFMTPKTTPWENDPIVQPAPSIPPGFKPIPPERGPWEKYRQPKDTEPATRGDYATPLQVIALLALIAAVVIWLAGRAALFILAGR